jgi:hypothetical protein
VLSGRNWWKALEVATQRRRGSVMVVVSALRGVEARSIVKNSIVPGTTARRKGAGRLEPRPLQKWKLVLFGNGFIHPLRSLNMYSI